MTPRDDSDDTLDDVDASAARRRVATSAVPALYVAWSTVEPEHIGDVALFPDCEQRLMGRGPGRLDDPVPRVTFVRQRPGENRMVPPLLSRLLSRQQLLVSARGSGLWFRRIGRSCTYVNGIACDEGTLGPGDVLRLDGHMALLCVLRPLQLPRLQHHPAPDFAFGMPDAAGFVGESTRAWALRDELALHARGAAHVLLLGGSGSGKELAARALHLLSPRAALPLVARNASTFPETLIDAELFGNTRNYPNPGMRERPGVVGEADGSTLFLDEIGEAPHSMQAHLLRLLDGGEYHRLGEATARRARLRVVGATNRDLAELKHDFVARFVARVRLPSLRERAEDVPLLLCYLARQGAGRIPALAALCDDNGHLRADARLIDALLRHSFPLNVRELEQIMLRATIGAERVLPLVDLRPPLPQQVPNEPLPALPTPHEAEAALQRHGGNRAAASRELGLRNRYVLYRLLRKSTVTRKEPS